MQTYAGPGHGKRRWGVGLVLAAVVVGLLSIGAVVWAGWSAVQGAREAFGDAEQMPGGTVTVSMQAGETRVVLADDGAGGVSCTVSGPDDQPLDAEDPAEIDQRVQDAAAGSGTFLRAFTAEESGEHTVQCQGGATRISGPLSTGDWIPRLLGLVGGVLGFGLGFLLLAGGLVLYLVGWLEDRRAREATVA